MKDDDFGLELVLGSAGEGTQQSEMQDKPGESVWSNVIDLGIIYIEVIIKDENDEIPEEQSRSSKEKKALYLGT